MAKRKKIFTTGVNSGIGKYIYNNIGGIGLTRSTSDEDFEKIKRDGVDIIIHCAFNSKVNINSDSLYQYLEDNVLLTKKLLSIPHKKFIFFSTVDIYPKDNKYHSEDETIEINSICGIYGITKMISESIVRNFSKNYIILRPTALLGLYSRKNTLIEILESINNITINLSANSVFNFVLYSDILNFIKFSINNDIKGIYNLSSSKNIVLSEIVKMLGKKVQFGNYIYNVGNINNTKISSIFPAFNKTSLEVINQFIEERENV
ncbi:MAG: NAD(P)-dependent oxidoreductase [bacterium]